MAEQLTVRHAVTEAVDRLMHGAAPANARNDADALMMYTLGCNRAFLLTNRDRPISREDLGFYEECVARRAAGEPMQYIVGVQEFYGLPFRVGPEVLIPRPETEHLVEAMLERFAENAELEIADVGTGSGAIAVALAHLLPRARVVALDNSPGALSYAEINADQNEVSDRVRVLQSDLLQSVAGERFDAVVSNPPYVAEEDRETLAIEVRDHEPSAALFAGKKGLDVYERLIPQASQVLKPGGWLLMEIGFGQQPDLERLLDGWDEVSFVPDLQGIARVACARLRT